MMVAMKEKENFEKKYSLLTEERHEPHAHAMELTNNFALPIYAMACLKKLQRLEANKQDLLIKKDIKQRARKILHIHSQQQAISLKLKSRLASVTAANFAGKASKQALKVHLLKLSGMLENSDKLLYDIKKLSNFFLGATGEYGPDGKQIQKHIPAQRLLT